MNPNEPTPDSRSGDPPPPIKLSAENIIVNSPNRSVDPGDLSGTTHELMFQAVFERALEAMLIVDQRGAWVDANSAACALLGRSRTDLLSRPLTAYLELAGETNWQTWQPQGELRLRTANGTWREVEYTLTADFMPQRHLLICHDLTARKRRELALEASELRYRLATQAGQVGVWDWNIKTNEIYVDPQLKTMLGFSADEIADEFAVWQALVHPDDLAQVTTAIERYLAGDSAEYLIEHRMCHKDGSIRWFLARGILLRDAAGQPDRMIGTRTQITERKQLEQALQTSETQLRKTLDQASAAIITRRIYHTGGWEYVFCSAGCAWVYGYACEQLLAEPTLWESRVFADDRAMVLERLFAPTQTAGTQMMEYRFQPLSGSVRWIATTLTAQWEAAANAWSVTSVSTDITDRKQAELAVRQALEREQQAIHRERFIRAITQNIRQSLDLDYILTTTVEEVQQFLQVDRVIIYQFNPDWSGRVIVEALEDQAFSLLGHEIIDPCFGDSMLISYRQRRIHAIDDVETADLSLCYRELLNRLQVRAVLAIPILVHQDLWGLLIAHQCTEPRQWQQINWLLLQQLSTQLAIGIHQAELYRQTQQQARKEHILNQVIQAIRNSLDLDIIFATATTAIGRLLEVDRAEIAQYLAAQQLWMNVASYRRSLDLPEALGIAMPDAENRFANQLKQGEIIQFVAPIAPDMPLGDLASLSGAWLLVPLRVGATVWGNLSINQQARSWQWQDWEVETVSAIADQLAIAIQQSHLYQQVRQLNLTLETQVHDRTGQLQQSLSFEELLKRITDKVRDSLDENQILQTAVQELAIGLDLVCCDAAFYDLDRQTSTIGYEYLRAEMQSAVGKTIAMADMAEIYQQAVLGHCIQFCWQILPPNSVRGNINRYTMLFCPLLDDRTLLGDLWLFRPLAQWFDPLEIRLVQQVANQCAIAIRQSRLYQAAQTQVEELERVNQLKDDFLSTVSHELRTPMSNIRLATQMLEIAMQNAGLLQTDPDSEAVLANFDRYFKILREECDREISLINNLLELTRLDAALEPLFVSPINLRVLLPHLVEPFADRVRRQNQQIELHFAASLPTLTTDLSYLERILAELMTNACKYTPIGETIRLAAEASPTTLQIRITNTGVEIPPQERDRVFDKFYRIPNNDPWKYGGTGLGLALVKKLAERLHAQVWVESIPGQTTFVLQFALDAASQPTN